MSNPWTPGPWGLDPTGDHKRIRIGKGLVEGPNGYDVAEVYSDDCDYSVAEANARLIAAAPEIMEALAYCVAVLGGFRNEGCTSDVVCSAHDEARALIARIRGDAP